MSSTDSNQLYLLVIRGTLSTPALDSARTFHNETAGAPPSVAVAQALGDLSHMVHVPVERSGSGPSEFLIMDLWNSMNGLNQFFANPQVQEQAGRIFSARDPVVWVPAQDFTTYHIPAPYGKNDRIVALARGKVKSPEETRKVHNKIIGAQTLKARRAGKLSHQTYFRLAQPGSPEASEFLAVDTWMDAAGMKKYYEDKEFIQSFHDLFSNQPVTSTWVHPPGDWVEW